MRTRRLRTEQLNAAETARLRELLWAAFAHDDEEERFTEEDWQHALGGVHFVYEVDGLIVAHASVVERDLHVSRRPVATGYVEAVATDPAQQGRGYGTAVMRAANEHILAEYELGALGTGSQGFYERLGWQVWRGPTYVRMPAADVATPDEDGYIMVLTTPATADLNLTEPITCDWRPGDVW